MNRESRNKEKAASRRKDSEDLESGKATKEELQGRNSILPKGFFDNVVVKFPPSYFEISKEDD